MFRRPELPPTALATSQGIESATDASVPILPRGQNDLLLDWARHRGRVSRTQAADLLDVSVLTAGRRLAALAADGLLAPSRPNGTGRGFHYLPAPG